LQDSFNAYESILEYSNGILTYIKVCNEGIAMYLEGILMYNKIQKCILTPKVLEVFSIKTASKQPLPKIR
jgi:hypothetical protein